MRPLLFLNLPSLTNAVFLLPSSFSFLISPSYPSSGLGLLSGPDSIRSRNLRDSDGSARSLKNVVVVYNWDWGCLVFPFYSKF